MQRFRRTKNVSFQDYHNLGAHNQHYRCGIVSHPPTSHQPVTGLGVGFGSEVVDSLSSGWIVTELCEYEFSSAFSCHPFIRGIHDFNTDATNLRISRIQGLRIDAIIRPVSGN